MDASTAPLNASLRLRRLENLQRLLRPRSIAFVGGSQLVGAIRAARAAGFDGAMHVVNPTRESIEGLRCIKHISELPKDIDAALIAVSPQRAVETVSALRTSGVGGAVCLASGFGEAGHEGRSIQQAMVDAAGEMALLGPNCMGVLNQFDGSAVWGEDTHCARIEGDGCAIVSQSGAFLIGITGVEEAFPLGYAISTGNQAMISAAECIEALLEDPRVRAVGLYIEGIEDGAALGAACWKAASRGVPVVALKGGDQAAGAAVAVSHTGAMVVERTLWDAFCDRFGVVEVSSPKALVETLKLLSVAGVPAGNRVGLVSFSGGANGLFAARAGGLGLALPQPGPETAAELRAKLPDTVPIANPMDLNVPFRSKNGLSLADGDAIADLLVLMGRDVADQFVFLVDIPRADERRLNEIWLPCVIAMETVAQKLKRPCAVAGILPEGLDPTLRHRLLDAGVAPLCGFNETMEALSISARISGSNVGHGASPGLIPVRSIGTSVTLDEAEGKSMLEAVGVDCPSRRICKPSDAVGVADDLGYPVALKLLSRTVQHKARVGGVCLNLADATEVSHAVRQMEGDVARYDIRLVQILLERMISNVQREVIVGVSRSTTFGLSLIVGNGGSNVESEQQFSTTFLPISESGLDKVLEERGLSKFPAVKDAVLAVAEFATRNADRVEEIEINPLILTKDGRAFAADAVLSMVLPEEGRMHEQH